jgi:hypothetical protein
MHPRCDIVIVSYLPDLQWLLYNLQFLCKNWKEPDSRFIVRLEPNCREHVERWAPNPRIIYHYVEPWPDGYHFHMFQKMVADAYTDAELIILLDSDVMLLRPASLDDLLSPEGKPLIYYLNWADADPVALAKWRGPTSQLLGIDLDGDYMVTVPFTYWRETFGLTRDRIAEVTGKPFKDAVYSELPFNYRNFLVHPMIYADYEALGLYAAKFQPDRYEVRPRPSGKDWPFSLYWSHTPFDTVRAELDQLLA